MFCHVAWIRKDNVSLSERAFGSCKCSEVGGGGALLSLPYLWGPTTASGSTCSWLRGLGELPLAARCTGNTSAKQMLELLKRVAADGGMLFCPSRRHYNVRNMWNRQVVGLFQLWNSPDFTHKIWHSFDICGFQKVTAIIKVAAIHLLGLNPVSPVPTLCQEGKLPRVPNPTAWSGCPCRVQSQP